MAPAGDEIVGKFASEVAGKTGELLLSAFIRSASSDRLTNFSVLITGPSESGVGAQTALSLAAANPKLIILAGRDESKIQPVIDQIFKAEPDAAVTSISLDLASQVSIREAGKKVNSQIQSLDILINNAGSEYTFW
jgi:NADP-dependent 3-hydroxy acid dehydrogenase YdfG